MTKGKSGAFFQAVCKLIIGCYIRYHWYFTQKHFLLHFLLAGLESTSEGVGKNWKSMGGGGSYLINGNSR